MNLVDMAQPSQSDACAAVTAMATLQKRPVDIIFVVDTSGSMSEEIAGINSNINTNFANIIQASGLDYRVIIVADWCIGTYCICVKPPLGGNTCTSESKPVNTTHLFHYDYDVESYDSLTSTISTYNTPDPNGQAPGGWSDWLRQDSLKIFVEVTDDYPTSSAGVGATFDTNLLALTPSRFGTAAKRDYVYYSIVGVKEKNPATAAWLASELPASTSETDKCSTAEHAGLEYQKLSHLTGGQAFPVCQSANFDTVFQAIAQGVVAGAKVSCNFDVPAAPGGQTIDLKTVVVNYTQSTSGASQSFTQVPDAAHCAPNSFYITSDADAGGDQIVLCPDTCNAVQADDKAQIGVLFDCSSTVS